MKIRLIILFSLLYSATAFGQVENLHINWGVVENGYQGKLLFVSEFTFENKGTLGFKDKTWSFCFNSCKQLLTDSVSGQVKITRINGDFYKMEPTASFPTLKPEEKVKIRTVSNTWAYMKGDAPEGGYFVKNGICIPTLIHILPFLKPEQNMRFAGDKMPVETAEVRYKKFEDLTVIAKDQLSPIIPTPTLLNMGEGHLKIAPLLTIVTGAESQKEANILADFLIKSGKKVKIQLIAESATGPSAVKPITGPGVINLKLEKLNNTQRPEFYFLYINPETGISISAEGNAGLFYGIQSLKSLLLKEPVALPEITVMDNPRFAYRGVMLDVARNFQSKETVLKLLDRMAFYKLNRLHFHLSDDEGWRIAIPGLAELTEFGAFRGHTFDGKDHLYPSNGSGPFAQIGKSDGCGFYSKADFIQILKYAADRHIEIIPEIDMPGHARAAIQSMEFRYNKLMKLGKKAEADEFRLIDPEDHSVYQSVQGWNDNVVCPCKESVYHFFEKVTGELAAMYNEAGLTLNTIHTGGDEVPQGVWTKSPLCTDFISKNPAYPNPESLQVYLIKRLNELLLAKNLNTAGWEEIAIKHVDQAGKQVPVVNNAFTAGHVISYIWNSVWGWGNEDTGYKLANAGYKVVMCNAPNMYFDLAYCKDSVEPGYTWAGFLDTRNVFSFTPTDLANCAFTDRLGNVIDQVALKKNFTELTPEGKQNIMGIQACLWGENVKGAGLVDYMMFPRLLALSERAWAKKPAWESEPDATKRMAALNEDWNRFANTIGQLELVVLDQLGVKYRKPSKGKMVENGVAKMNSEFPRAK